LTSNQIDGDNHFAVGAIEVFNERN